MKLNHFFLAGAMILLIGTGIVTSDSYSPKHMRIGTELSDAPSAASINDTTPPTITFLNPQEGYLHFSGRPLIPNPFSFMAPTMTVGGFRLGKVQVRVLDDVDYPSDITVIFSLNGEEQGYGTFVPCDQTFQWAWTGMGFGTYTLGVTAEDRSGNVGNVAMEVWYACFLP